MLGIPFFRIVGIPTRVTKILLHYNTLLSVFLFAKLLQNMNIVAFTKVCVKRIYPATQNKRMNGMKEHTPDLFGQFVNCFQHIVIV